MAGFTGLTHPFYNDLVFKHQHILIAGMTGSGKSVFENGMINSILYKSPADHAMVLIDPKRVELSRYKTMPHCIGCGVTTTEIESLLRRCVLTIEKRFQEMEARDERMYSGTKIHIFIDEMADLMMLSRKSADYIQRIAQIGRAANVQLICATQCPLAEVIPTRIKVNFGIIVGLHTRSRQDSRNIIGQAGCEDLPQYGRALIQFADQVELQETVVPQIPDEEIKKIINYRKQEART